MATEAFFDILFQSSVYSDETTWQSPLLSDLEWNNCTAIADYWADQINIVNEKTDSIDFEWGNLGKLIAFLGAVIPQGWSQPSNPIHLAAWYWFVWADLSFESDPGWNDAQNTINDSLMNGCRPELCNRLDIQGDPDVSGPGMMGSYYVAAALSTVYFLVLVVNRVRGDKSNSRIFAAFRDSANTFLDALLIFTASMLASTVSRYTSFDRHLTLGDLDPDAFSSYQLIGAVALSVFCVFPCLVLQTVAGGIRVRTVSGERRIRFLRLFLWVAIVALTITVEVQYSHVYPELWEKVFDISFDSIAQFPGLYREWWWLNFCDDTVLLFKIITAVTAGHAILGIQLVWLLYYLVAYAARLVLPKNQVSRLKDIRRHKIGKKPIGEHWKQLQPFLRLVNGVLCGIMMWVLIVLFTLYRNHLRDIASQTSLDGKWTFGQVLSLFTWVPVVIEWLLIFSSGSEKGLSQRVPDRYHVTKIPEGEPSEGSATGYNRVKTEQEHVTEP